MDPEKVLEMIHPHNWCENTRDVREEVDFPSEYLQVPPDERIDPEVKERARKACEKFQRRLMEKIERGILVGVDRTRAELPPGYGKVGNGYDQAAGRKIRPLHERHPVKILEIATPMYVDEAEIRKRIEHKQAESDADFTAIEVRIAQHCAGPQYHGAKTGRWSGDTPQQCNSVPQISENTD